MNNDSRKVSPVVFVAILIEIFVVVVMIFTFVNFQREKAENSSVEISHRNVVISNLNEKVPNLTKNSVKNLMFSVNDIVWLNNKNAPEKITGNVREGTVDNKYYAESNTYVVKFTIDLPELKQSYKVAHVYMKQDAYQLNIPTNQRLIIYCPDEAEMVYGGQVCRDRYAGTAKDVINGWDFSAKL